MFDFSFGEVGVIAVVALLVLGPERLPKVARTSGALLRKARRSWQGVREEIEREFAAEELKRSLKETAQQADPRAALNDAVHGTAQDVRAATRLETVMQPLPVDTQPVTPGAAVAEPLAGSVPHAVPEESPVASVVTTLDPSAPALAAAAPPSPVASAAAPPLASPPPASMQHDEYL